MCLRGVVRAIRIHRCIQKAQKREKRIQNEIETPNGTERETRKRGQPIGQWLSRLTQFSLSCGGGWQRGEMAGRTDAALAALEAANLIVPPARQMTSRNAKMGRIKLATR